jgi:tetratricopeptide (TPR) repeat protein
LTRAYPNEKYYQKRLAEAMSMIGDSLISTPNRAEAFSHYQESIALWEKLAGKSDLQGDCLVGLGKAHHKLAAAYHSASRFEEAITEYRAALAVFDRAVRSAPTPDEARGNAATVDNDLFQLYNSRNDYQHALEALLQARPFAEANYAAHPDHRAARSMAFIVYDRLSRAYNSLQRNEEALAAALREVQTAEDYARDPSPFWYFDYVSRSESRLGDTYLRLKRRADSLAALGKAVVVWDGLPRDFEITGNDLAQMAGDLNNAALFLRELDEEPLSWQACSKTVANIRTIISRNPLGDNPIEFAGSNVMFQRCSDIAGDRNDWESAIQLRTEWQKLAAEHPLPLAQFWRTLGDDQLKIGSAQDLLGRPEAAAKARMRAREYFLKMRDVAQGLVTSSQGKNLAALQSLVIANLSLSFLSEREGESKGAIEYAKTALDAAQKLAAADSRTPAFQSLLGDAKGTMARLQSLADPKAAVAPLDFASGWRAYANLCVSETFYPCLEEARRAVELGRKAASTAPSAESRNALALELSQLGASARVAAKNSRGAARRAALEQSIAANKECLDTVAALEREGLKSAIPPLNRQVIAVAVENAKAKLAAMDPAVDSARK